MKEIILRTMIVIALPLLLSRGPLSAQTPYQSDADFQKYAEKLRQSAILRMEPETVIPTTARPVGVSSRYPWKTGIVTTVFSIESASAWDPKWRENYGGFDNPKPEARRNFVPAAFIPRLNPFYIALPYNDTTAHGATKPEAKTVIPWFKEAFVEEGKSVCRDRWVAIRNAAGKVCYAQWSDCGPFGSDHWQYVFGNEKPKPNANQGAGLNISPAVRDFLGLITTDVTDWKFVEFKDVPKGPWSLFGDNNQFVQETHHPEERATDASPPPPKIVAPALEGPAINTTK